MTTGSLGPSEFFQSHFASVLASTGDHGPVGNLVRAMVNEQLSEDRFTSIVDAYGVRRDSWFRGQVLDLVLGYIVSALESHPRLRPEHQADIKMLRKHLEIRDGEFMERRPAEVAAILNEQFERILEDGIIDSEEELYQVELQAAFGLGYDDYLAVTRRACENAYSDLQLLAARDSEALQKLRALEPLYRLVTLRPRGLGALY
jgi:AcrR family transcriptional regulator